MSNLTPRLTRSEVAQLRRAGYELYPTTRKASFFGSMFSWFPTLRFGLATYWPVGGNARPPVNSATAASGQTVTPESALTVSAVWACVWLIARTIATLPLELKRLNPNGAGTNETGDPLFDVLRYQPNAYMTAAEFWTMMWASVLLWGNGYAVKVYSAGKIVALEPLRPEFMTPYITDKGALRYRYDEPQKPKDYAAAEIFHLRDRSLDGLSGASVIEFARNSLGIAQSGELAAGKTFKKGLNASGFIQVDKFLTAENREAFRTSIAEFTGDGSNAGGTMVLEGGVTYSQLSMKPMDAELLASRQFSVEDVCRWFGVPPILIGHSAQGQTMWGSGVEQIFSGWTRLNLRPYLTTASQLIRSSLIAPADRARLYAEFDLDDLLAADSQARANLYSTFTQNGVMTRNEVREKEGLPAMEGGDVLTVQSNLIPISNLGNPDKGASGTADNVRNALLDLLQLQAQRQDTGAGAEVRKP